MSYIIFSLYEQPITSPSASVREPKPTFKLFWIGEKGVRKSVLFYVKIQTDL